MTKIIMIFDRVPQKHLKKQYINNYNKQAQLSLDKSKLDKLYLGLLVGLVKFSWGWVYFSLVGFSLV